MGKVRVALIKRVAKQMIANHPDRFSRDFEQNKKSLAELNLTPRLRNRIAGYISALMTPSKIPVQAMGEEKPLFDSDEATTELNQEGEPVVERVQADEFPSEAEKERQQAA